MAFLTHSRRAAVCGLAAEVASDTLCRWKNGFEVEVTTQESGNLYVTVSHDGVRLAGGEMAVPVGGARTTRETEAFLEEFFDLLWTSLGSVLVAAPLVEGST